jgi:hypothetical protein
MRSRVYVRTLLLLLSGCFLLGGTSAASDHRLQAAIHGTVRSDRGLPVGYGVVLLSGTVCGATFDSNGTYVLPRITPGTCSLSVARIGYPWVRVRDLYLAAGDSVRIDFTLSSMTQATCGGSAGLTLEQKLLSAAEHPRARRADSTSVLHGVVFDPSGTGCSSVLVWLDCSTATLSDADGFYCFWSAIPGNYRLSANADRSTIPVFLRPGQSTRADLTLDLPCTDRERRGAAR